MKRSVKSFAVEIIHKPAFELAGFTKLVHLDGVSIANFLKTLNETGQMEKLSATLHTPQQVWVCLSWAGDAAFDCRCTVCVEKTEEHDFCSFAVNEIFTLSAPASDWADFTVGGSQSPTELHSHDVYQMVEEIGYTYHAKVGFHLDNEHEWSHGKEMHFLLPVCEKEISALSLQA